MLRRYALEILIEKACNGMHRRNPWFTVVSALVPLLAYIQLVMLPFLQRSDDTLAF